MIYSEVSSDLLTPRRLGSPPALALLAVLRVHYPGWARFSFVATVSSWNISCAKVRGWYGYLILPTTFSVPRDPLPSRWILPPSLSLQIVDRSSAPTPYHPVAGVVDFVWCPPTLFYPRSSPLYCRMVLAVENVYPRKQDDRNY